MNKQTSLLLWLSDSFQVCHFPPGFLKSHTFLSEYEQWIFDSSSHRFSWCILNSAAVMISASHPLSPSCVLLLFLFSGSQVKKSCRNHIQQQRNTWAAAAATAAAAWALSRAETPNIYNNNTSAAPGSSSIHSAPTHTAAAANTVPPQSNFQLNCLKTIFYLFLFCLSVHSDRKNNYVLCPLDGSRWLWKLRQENQSC